MANFWSISMLLVLLVPAIRADFKYLCICCLNRTSNTGDIKHIQCFLFHRMALEWSIFWVFLMFLVLLKPVSRTEFKYVCIVWIGNQIREISTADLRCRVKWRLGTILRGFFRPRINKRNVYNKGRIGGRQIGQKLINVIN